MSTVRVEGDQRTIARYSRRLRLTGELLVVAMCTTAVYFLAQLPVLVSGLPSEPTHLIAFLATAGAAAAAAILASQIARITRNSAEVRRLAMISAAMGAYAVVVVPFSTALYAAGGASPSLWSGQLVAHLVTLVILIGALIEHNIWWLRRWAGLAIAAGLALGTAVIAACWPEFATALTDTDWLHVAVFTGWVAVALGFAVDGMRRGHALTWRIGLGLIALNASQLVWLASEPPGSATAYVVPALQALAVGGIVLALVWRLRVIVAAMHERQHEEAEQARASLAALLASQERTAVRDHEIRNLVAGLSGVSHLLGNGSAQGDAAAQLGAALREELQRLHSLVDGETGEEEPRAQVGAVLGRLAMLHRANGMDIELDAEPGLAAAIRPSTLTQVLANVLSNCARHAPGAAVHIRAYHGGDDKLFIEVHDDGPGLPSSDFTATADGTGMGLSECHELLSAEDGSLRLGSSDRFAGAKLTVAVTAAKVLEHR